MANNTWCENCNADQQYGKFCTKCGSKLTENKNKCACGEELWPYMKFCPECGKSSAKEQLAGVQ